MTDLIVSFNFKTRCQIGVISLLLLTLLGSAPHLVYAVEPEEALTLIQTGEAALTSTFENVLRAARLEVNISDLLQKLNDANALLEQAAVSFENNLLDDVVRLATSSIELTETVNEEALQEIQIQSTQRTLAFNLNLILTIIGIVGFSFFLVLLWRWFKGYYFQKILNSKPEVSYVVGS